MPDLSALFMSLRHQRKVKQIAAKFPYSIFRVAFQILKYRGILSFSLCSFNYPIAYKSHDCFVHFVPDKSGHAKPPEFAKPLNIFVCHLSYDFENKRRQGLSQ